MTQYSKIGTALGTALGITSDKLALLIQIRGQLSAVIDNIFIQTAILAFLGGACGYMGTKAIEGIHKWWTK